MPVRAFTQRYRHSAQALDRGQSTTYLQGECSCRCADSVCRFDVGQVLVLDNPQEEEEEEKEEKDEEEGEKDEQVFRGLEEEGEGEEEEGAVVRASALARVVLCAGGTRAVRVMCRQDGVNSGLELS